MIQNHTVWLKYFWSLLMVCGLYISCSPEAAATHIRAGEITAKSDTAANPNPLLFYFKLVTYVDPSTGIPDLNATLFFGDGTSDTQPKVSDTPVGNNTDRRVFYFSHIYPSAGRNYTVTYNEQNRFAGIINISSPATQSFYVTTTISINPQIGINRSPQFAVPPIDVAAQGQLFVHLPGAYDLDQDSLSYKMRVPQQNTGTTGNPIGANVLGYRAPEDPSFGGTTIADPATGTPAGQPVKFTLNPVTGEIRWNVPNTTGAYNIAFVVEEWKVIPGRNPIKIGEVTRDMQITVRATLNRRPLLRIPKDTCVVAGRSLIGNVSATDGNNPADPLTFQAFASIIPPATFVQSSPTTGTFRWTPQCTDISEQPYQVVFKVTDNPGSSEPRLTDLQAWNIKVVGPPPTGLSATLQPGRQMLLNWNNYLQNGCGNAEKIMIYRRENLANFTPGACETGVPSSTGYQKIAEVAGGVTSFLDTNNGTGLTAGINYCYLIYATFPAPKRGESLASLEACAEVPITTSVITNVSVLETSPTTGQIEVKWSEPLIGAGALQGPFEYRLYRSAGQNGNPTFQQIHTTANVAATTFTDTNLNTEDNAYTYKVEFYHTVNGSLVLLEEGSEATSVRLEAESKGETLVLDWNYDVPWDNSKRKHLVYREVNGAFALIDSIVAGPETGQYTDRGTFNNIPLETGKSYCYYIETVGVFTNPKLPPVVLNNSQIFCVTLRDTIPPCPPVLALLKLNCDSLQGTPFAPPFRNSLSWQPATRPECDDDIKEFNLYFREPGAADFVKLNTTTGLSFAHQNLLSPAGCYVVTAVDSSGNESSFSNIVCQEVCFFLELPNIITPNGDGYNDTFRPRQSAFIKSVKFSVFNRWGVRVFEKTTGPTIDWAGENNGGGQVSDGVYYYLAEVEFAGTDPANSKRTFKGWVEVVR
ncbi:MAG TPA: gliding motility-associated C-terminal domain-containing protein [Adhaeribacter sp.]|nr:gliding motility-associated C-terminal domain-containing protein [Adhaeribacter sp.]